MPTLYKKSTSGKLVQWTITVQGDTYTETYGYVGMKLQTTPGTKCVGKQGRNDVEQAEAEARSKWEKKQKAGGYVLTKEAAMGGETSELVEGGILPMLAHKFGEHGEKLKYPCFVQPKLDGHRCIGMVSGLWSRTRKAITGVPHIHEDIVDNQLLTAGMSLDGELYNHEYRSKFEELTSFIKRDEPKDGCEVVEYHVYDCIMKDRTFRERWEHLENIIGTDRGGPVMLVETREVHDEDELMLAFEDFLAQGYEGAIARNANGPYVGKRSYDLLKIKQFDDAEFLCVGVEEGRGKLAGHAIFICSIGRVDGPGKKYETELVEHGFKERELVFNAKLKGDQSELKKYFSNPALVIGKRITVQYQGLTKNGIPRFPVALRIEEKL